MSNLSIRQIYSQGRPNPNFGIQGYSLPRTVLYSKKKGEFSSTLKYGLFYQSPNASINPGPSQYSESQNTTNKRFWQTKTGQFRKTNPDSFVQISIKQSNKIPPIGHYQLPLPPQKFVGGSIPKGAKKNFMSDLQYKAHSTPSTWMYDTDDSLIKPRPSSVKMVRSRSQQTEISNKKLNKDRVGPGAYHDGLQSSQKLTRRTTTSYSIAKAKGEHFLMQRAKSTKQIPPVGGYNAYKGINLTTKMKRTIKPLISKSKIRRFTEKVMNEKSWVPGPGSYNIGVTAGQLVGRG